MLLSWGPTPSTPQGARVTAGITAKASWTKWDEVRSRAVATRWRWCSTSSPPGAELRRPATRRQWFLGLLMATQCPTDMLLPESSSSWEAATPSFQGLRLQILDSPLAHFPPNPHTSHLQRVNKICRLPAECMGNLTTSPHRHSAHPVLAYVCSAGITASSLLAAPCTQPVMGSQRTSLPHLTR